MDRFPKLELSNISIQSEGSRYKVSIIGSFASKKFRVSSVSYEFENTIIDLRKKVLNHIYRFKSYDKVLRTKFNLRLVSDPCNENEL